MTANCRVVSFQRGKWVAVRGYACTSWIRGGEASAYLRCSAQNFVGSG
jgi:hypothetical protein